MKVITYEEWIEQTERLTKQQVALLKAQDAIGKSAYEIAVAEGFEGDVTEWLESLVGEEGPQGEIGLSGKSAYDIYLENYGELDGEELELEAWLESLHGEDGADGDSGPDGESAYELAVVNGFEGDETAWLASLKGADGVSAYELAVEGGLNDVEEGEGHIDEATFGALLAELIRERFIPIGEE